MQEIFLLKVLIYSYRIRIEKFSYDNYKWIPEYTITDLIL